MCISFEELASVLVEAGRSEIRGQFSGLEASGRAVGLNPKTVSWWSLFFLWKGQYFPKAFN